MKHGRLLIVVGLFVVFDWFITAMGHRHSVLGGSQVVTVSVEAGTVTRIPWKSAMKKTGVKKEVKRKKRL